MKSQVSPSAASLRRARSRPSARTVTLSALAIVSLLGGSLPAFAGPDDGKIVTTQDHIDAPKTAWIDGNFVLRNEAPPQGGKSGPYSADESIIWIGKGWSEWSGASQYTFTVGAEPQQSFLGEAGDSLYLAPMLPQGNHNPAWVGYGAELDIPVEDFRDGTFALDIMEVRGPGEVELFRYHESWGPLSLKRMMSSKTQGLNSARLTPGSHTHNATTFTTAGRYEIVYRTVARGHNGEIIQSEPTTIVWQVGGRSPRSGEGVADEIDTLTRYEQAPVGDLGAEKYSLSVRPYEGRRWAGDNHLSQIDFTAANEDLDGTLTLYNNGYFLTDLQVREGRASWLEVLGSTPGQLQAVFTPSGEAGSRWISQALTYSPGEAGQTGSDVPEGSWPQEQPDPDNVTMTGQLYTPSSGNFTATIADTEHEGYKRVRVETQDPNFRGFLGGGVKANDSDYYSFTFEGHFVDGVAEYVYSEDGFYNGEQALVEVIPHPDMNARSATLTLAENYQGDQAYQEQGAFEITESPEESDVLQPTPEPTSPPNPQDKLPQCFVAGDEGRYLLSDGHIDLKGKYEDGQLSAVLRDETGQIVPVATDRSLEEVVLGVGDNAKQRRSGHLLGSAYDFLGDPSATFYGLPQTQQAGLIWPGWNTQELDYSQFDGSVSLHLNPLSIPEDARYAVYQDSAFGGLDLLLDSGAEDYSLEVDFATHAHANWIFTAPGIYDFEVYYSAYTKDGQELRSAPQKLTYLVGDQAIQDCLKGADEGPVPPEAGDEDAPEPSFPPSASPSPSATAPSPSATPSPAVPSPSDSPSATLSLAAPIPSGSPSASAPSSSATPSPAVQSSADSSASAHLSPVDQQKGPGEGQSGADDTSSAKGSSPAPSTASGTSLASTGASALGISVLALLALAAGALALTRYKAY